MLCMLSVVVTGTVAFKKPWKGCPDPRGSHSGNLIGNSLIVFGGYGGPGFSRRDFNDVHVLDLSTWEWMEIEATGEQPEPRSGHQVQKIPFEGRTRYSPTTLEGYLFFVSKILRTLRVNGGPRESTGRF